MKFTNGPKAAQECLTADEAVPQADPRYPCTDREIASRLVKTCKRGRLDYQEYRTRGGNSAVDVPEAEIFAPEVFPVSFSRHQALIRGDNPDDLKLPEYALKDVPLPKQAE